MLAIALLRKKSPFCSNPFAPGRQFPLIQHFKGLDISSWIELWNIIKCWRLVLKKSYSLKRTLSTQDCLRTQICDITEEKKTYFHIFANIKNICANMWQFMIVCISLCTKKGTSFYITFRKYVIEIYSIYVTASCFLEILWTCHRNQRFRLREKCFFVLKPPLLKAPIDCSFVGSFNWKIFVHKGAILTTDSQSRF